MKISGAIFKHAFPCAMMMVLVSCQPTSPEPKPNAESVVFLKSPDTDAALKRVEAFWNHHLPGYMNGTSTPVTYPGWEGYPTRKHRYVMSDGRSAEVILCNADAKQLARWIVTTCLVTKGSADARYTDRLCKAILEQSGAQYPVAGIVLENMDGRGSAIYVFRDGVTATLEGIPNGSLNQPTQAQISKAMDPAVQPVAAGKYARIQSTTREEYRRAGGTLNTRGTAWLNVSRTLYQEAWGKDRNELMIAWAKSNL